MLVFKSNIGLEGSFEDLMQAKRQFIPGYTWEDIESRFVDGKDHRKDFEDYKDGIRNAANFEELLKVASKYSALFGNGATYFVGTI